MMMMIFRQKTQNLTTDSSENSEFFSEQVAFIHLHETDKQQEK